jgi:hypothetical protein
VHRRYMHAIGASWHSDAPRGLSAGEVHQRRSHGRAWDSGTRAVSSPVPVAPVSRQGSGVAAPSIPAWHDTDLWQAMIEIRHADRFMSICLQETMLGVVARAKDVAMTRPKMSL